MGAKQSKRSVDISGKEAEGAGEVAAAGAGGEGRMEPLADADALKPQLNGDAHIQTPHEQTDKEKQLDSGTPENEKDATTEKEIKQENGDEKEIEADVPPATNGDSEPKGENGEAAPNAEDGKKHKKEKVKKKWSLRSISFSRKEKPKQDKKQKEEESKTNGEPEKVPEEAAEATPEIVEEKVVAEAKPEIEVKDEKTPETPVTEPMTNGSSTPETPKAEIPASEEPTPTPAAQPDQLPINGLSLDEPKKEEPILSQSKESKTEDSKPESAADTVPAPEIPVKTEVCVEQMPLIEPTPPPLPANPPPSSVASFAATTMAPELTDASLPNTAVAAISTPAILDTKSVKPDEDPIQSQISTNFENITNENPIPSNKSVSEKPSEITKSESDIKQVEKTEISVAVGVEKMLPETALVEVSEKKDIIDVTSMTNFVKKEIVNAVAAAVVDKEDKIDISAAEDMNKEEEIIPTHEKKEIINEAATAEIEQSAPAEIPIAAIIEKKDVPADIADVKPLSSDINVESHISNETKDELPNDVAIIPEPLEIESVESSEIDDLPPPPVDDEITQKVKQDKIEAAMNSKHISMGLNGETELGNVKNSVKGVCNGKDCPESPSLSGGEEMPPAPLEEGLGSGEPSESFPLPPSDLSPSEETPPPQEPLPVSDKIADLIPEVPDVPEFKTEMLQETTNDVAVAN